VSEAIPQLEAAIDALQVLNQSDISTLKTMRVPPKGVRKVMEAICILLDEKPAKITDSVSFKDFLKKYS
jgi:dynein heavy chain